MERLHNVPRHNRVNVEQQTVLRKANHPGEEGEAMTVVVMAAAIARQSEPDKLNEIFFLISTPKSSVSLAIIILGSNAIINSKYGSDIFEKPE